MRKMIASLILVLGVMAVGNAHAFWFTAGLGYNSYSMSDVNKEVQAVNSLISPLHLDEINSGTSYGAGFGIPVSAKIDLGFGVEKFAADTQVGDATGSLKYDFAANVYKASLYYHFPTTSKFATGISGSLGRISSAGDIDYQETGVGSLHGNVTGSGTLVEGTFTADYWVSPKVAITGSAGYRIAKVNEIEVNGNPIYGEGGDRYAVDYSGLAIRVGIKVDFPSKK